MAELRQWSAPPREHGGRNTTPNDALQCAAGPAAARIAQLWPRPHRAYFDVEPARRHLINLLAARLPRGPAAEEAAAEALSSWSVRRVLSAYLPAAPVGLAEALRRLDGEGWGPDDYARLLALLAEGGDGAKLLRHAAAITRVMLEIASLLPPAMRRPRIIALLPTVALARLFRRGMEAGFSDLADPRAAGALADRLERSGATDALFAKLLDMFPMEQFSPGPLPGADWIVPIVGPKAMRAAALRFRNCLTCRIPAALSGSAAYYEVMGAEPAVVEIVLDRRGKRWVFGEMRGHANDALSAGLLAKIQDYLAAHGAAPHGRVNTVIAELALAARMGPG